MIDKDIVNDIREEIAAKIGADSTLFQSVYAVPRTTLAGFPSVVVVPSENEADWGSTTTDRMIFAFHLNVYYPVHDESEYAKAEEAVGECVGDLLRIFSQKNILTTAEWVLPVPSRWETTTIGEGAYRTAQIVLRCVKHVANH
jgi:hypothetical protein